MVAHDKGHDDGEGEVQVDACCLLEAASAEDKDKNSQRFEEEDLIFESNSDLSGLKTRLAQLNFSLAAVSFRWVY